MAKQGTQAIEVRVGSHNVFVTRRGADGSREDVGQLPRKAGADFELEIEQPEPETVTEYRRDGNNSLSRVLTAEYAIELLEQGVELDLDGETRKTVLAAAEAGATDSQDSQDSE